jgi:uncharacterized protein (DUF2062 family)
MLSRKDFHVNPFLMKSDKNNLNSKLSSTWLRKHHFREFIERAKTLQGDPHYVALGMALGVFVSVTPTIPFHTIIAIALAIVLRGSKPAAAIGVWFSNPITIPVFYIESYKTGMFMLGKSIPHDINYESIQELMTLGLDVTVATITGGAILGIVLGIAAYFITRKIFTKIRLRKKHETS